MRVNLARWLLDLSVVNGKCSVGYSASTPRKCAIARQKRVEVCVAKVVHPCRVKSFESHIVRGYVTILEKVLANKSQITYT